MADELTASRVTLFRQAERLPDDLHTSGTGRCFNAIVAKTGWLTSLLADESVLVIRLLTDPRGQVQTGVVNLFNATCGSSTSRR